MTQREMLILIAGTLPRQFSAEDLAIAAWRRWPHSFGMHGYDYPSTQRMYSLLSHKIGPIRQGYMSRPPAMELTAAGRAELARLTGDDAEPAQWLTEAERLWSESGGRDKLTARHAAEFFGLAYPSTHCGQAAQTICAKLADLAQNDTPSGRVRYHLADYLSEQFGRALGLAIQRSRM